MMPLRSCGLTALAGSLLAPLAYGQCGMQWMPGGDIPGVSGSVVGGPGTFALANWDPDGPGPRTEVLVVGGRFTHAVSALADNLATWDPATGVWSELGGGCDDSVADLLVLPGGELVVGGAFRAAGGVPASRVAQWDGVAWSMLGGGVNGPVGCLAVAPSGDLLVGGIFTFAGGSPAYRVARWDGTGWSALGNGPTMTPWDLVALPNGDVVSVGFDSSRGAVELWNGNSWIEIGTTMPPVWNQTGGPVEAAVWAQGLLWVGGSFSYMNGSPMSDSAVWDGTAWWPTTLPLAYVRELSVRPNGDVLAAGVGYRTSSAWTFDGQQWTSLDLDTGATYFTVEAVVDVPNGELVAGGHLFSVGGVQAQSLARWDGTSWGPFGTGLNAAVRAVAVLPSGDRVLAGDFTFAGGAPANRIVRWDGSSFHPLGTGFDDPVGALVQLANGDLVAGGVFLRAGTVTVNGIARFDGTTWSAVGSAAGNGVIVRSIVELGSGELIAAGLFSTIDGVAASNIARWDGSTWHPLGAGTSSWVRALAVSPAGDVYAGGDFLSAGGVPANNIAKWDGATWSPLGAGLPGGWVQALAVLPNGDLVAGGWFLVPAGAPANHIARWDGTQWSALGSAVSGPVEAMEVLPNGDLLVAGRFTFGGQQGPGLARFDGAQWFSIRSDLSGVEAMATAPFGRITVGGGFLTLGGAPSAFFAEAWPTCPSIGTPFGPSCSGPAGPVVLAVDHFPWIGSTCRATATGFAPGSLAASLLGLSATNVPLTSYLPVGLPGCYQLASQDAVQVHVPLTGAVSTAFAIPNALGFVGLPLYQQFLELGVGSQNQVISLSGSNGLALTIGAF